MLAYEGGAVLGMEPQVRDLSLKVHLNQLLLLLGEVECASHVLQIVAAALERSALRVVNWLLVTAPHADAVLR